MSVGTAALVARHLRSRASTSIVLALVVGIAVALSALLPRALVQVSDAELQHELTSKPPGATDLYGVGQFGGPDVGGSTELALETFDDTDAVLAGVPDGLPAPLGPALGRVSWLAVLPDDTAKLRPSRVAVQAEIRLAADLAWQDRVTFTAGSAPVAWSGSPDEPLQIAISADYAEQAGFEVGDVLEYTDAPLEVSGIYTVDDPASAYWVHAPELLSATISRLPSSPTIVRGAAYVDPGSVAFLPLSLSRAELRAWYPLIPETLSYADIPALDEELRRIESLGLYLPTGEGLLFQTRLPGYLETVTGTIRTVTAIAALSASAPLGALLAVLALGARAVRERRRSTLALAAARGAGQLQLRATLLLEGALIGIPATAIALVAVGIAVPTPVDASTWVLPALIGVVPPLLFGLGSLRDARQRTDLGGLGSRARWITELAVTGLAALALYLLARRGLVVTGSGVVDPLLAATPLLVALVVCIVVLRVYPLPLLALLRAARAGRGAVGLVGSASSLRASTAAFGSVLATVMGVSAAIFSLVLASSVTDGLRAAAVAETGADIRVDARVLDDLDTVSAIPGVAGVAALDTVQGVEIAFGLDRPHVTVVFADLRLLHGVRPDIPVVAPGSILVSADIAERSQGETTLDGHPVTTAGTLPTTALPGLTSSWVLADIADETAIIGEVPTYGSLLISVEPGADLPTVAGAVREVVTDAQSSADRGRVRVTDTSSFFTDAAARPSIAGLTVALLGAAGLALLLCVLAVALGALAAAGARARSAGVLGLLGMSPAQLRGVLVWELAPVTVTALIAGSGLGIALAVGMSALVDLGSIVGGGASVAVSIPWPLVGLVVVVFAGVVGATGALTAAAARRLDASAAVKIGAE